MNEKTTVVPSGYYDYVYRFMYFILLPLAPKIPARITPNQITVISFTAAMIGTILLAVIHTPVAFLYWMLFNFLFMLTVFSIKFDLLFPLYIYILILRTTAATMVFLIQFHTGKMLRSRFSGGLEFMLFNIVMLLSYCYPHINPADLTANPFLLHWINQRG